MKVIVEADGGSRGNPGPAGYGSVVWSADRAAVLAESKQSIGLATNSVAEYRGLIAGLTEAANVGAGPVARRAAELETALRSYEPPATVQDRLRVLERELASLAGVLASRLQAEPAAEAGA